MKIRLIAKAFLTWKKNNEKLREAIKCGKVKLIENKNMMWIENRKGKKSVEINCEYKKPAMIKNQSRVKFLKLQQKLS